ncbi:MAG: LssY C-terminal domain-containing protein [Acidobacteriia bacterium]|nr:LssY C-terminal domain-containing protein [Terriglobia bacterium]
MEVRFLLLRCVGVLLVAGFGVIPGTGQSVPGATPVSPQDFHFTISTAQPWTDTGVDLGPGEVLEITAKMPPSATGGSAASCDPQGTTSSAQSSNLPVPGAPPGALIARFQPEGSALLVGSGKQLKMDASGHLYFGVNGQATPPCAGGFSVTVHLVSAAAASTPEAENAMTSSKAQPPAPGQAQTSPAKPQDVKSKLEAAAQVWLAGQFGKNSAAQPNSAAAPGNAVTAGNTPAASSAPALKVSDTSLDAALSKDLDSLPRRVHDHFNNAGDMVNFVIVGSEQQAQSALAAAEWHAADRDDKQAVLNAIVQTYKKEDYVAMPMSTLYLFGRPQDFGYEQAEAYSVVASRHHFRLWKAPFTWNGQTVWVGAGTHDIGFEKDQRNGKVTHKIDPAVDGERDNIGASLQKTGKVKRMTYYLPPDPVQEAKNATGGGYHSDGRMLVIFLQ